MDSFTVGPFAFPTGPVLLMVAVLIAMSFGNRLAKRYGTDVERALWSILFVGIASARLAFVLLYWKIYMAQPRAILDLRDGGMNTMVGIAGAVVMGILLAVRSRAQRRPILLSLLTGLTLWGVTATALQVDKPATPLPVITLPDLQGQHISLRSFTGKPVIINLWASWCPPCRREISVLEAAQKAHNNVVFIFANQGESSKAVQTYIDSAGLLIKNVLLDQRGSIAKHAGAAGLPTTLFFDRNGTLVDTRVRELSQGSLAQRIESLQMP